MNTNKKRASPFTTFIQSLFHREQEQSRGDTDMIGVTELLALFGDDKPVTVTQALQIPAFSACVSLIAETLATMPVQLYTETDGKTEPLKGDNRVTLINDDTGDILNGMQFKTALVRDYLLYGNGYAYIRRQGNRIVSLHYVNAKEVSVSKNAHPIFKDAVFVIGGGRYEEYDFFKMCRNSKDGVTGTGLVAELSDLLTAQYKLLVFEKVLASSGGSKKGFLQAEKKLSEEVMVTLRQKWKELHSKPETGVFILNDGLKYIDANQTSVEMQLCELMKDGADKIYHACGVPSGLLSGTGTDEMWEMFYKTALLPVQKAFEATLNRDLLLYSEKRKLYFAFETKELLKGDMLKRYQGYDIALRAGFMQPDEVRYAEDLPALNLGFVKLGLQDVLLDPATMQIYTPNTNSFVKMGESNPVENGLQSKESDDTINLRGNPYRGKDGKYTFAPGGGAATRNSKRRKPLRVSEQEYAIIVDSISRNYDVRFKKYAGKGTCHVQSAIYDYRVEITDRHNFTILGRRKLQ